MLRLPLLKSDTASQDHRSKVRSKRSRLSSQSISTLDSLKRVSRETLRDLVAREKQPRTRVSSRDVSHVRDKRDPSAPPIASLYTIPEPTQCLPTGLDQLEKLLTVSNSLGLLQDSKLVQTCIKPHCIDRIMTQREKLELRFSEALPPKKTFAQIAESELPFITMVETMDMRVVGASTISEDDFLYLGQPTGRQDVENLKEWFQHMKRKYLGLDLSAPSFLESARKVQSGLVIYKACARELARQVAVLCVERGQLLVEVMSFFSDLWEKYVQKAESEFRILHGNYAETCSQLKQENSTQAETHKSQIRSLEKTIESLRKDLSDKTEDCHLLKKRMQHIHAHEQQILQRLMHQQDSLVEAAPRSDACMKKSLLTTYQVAKEKEATGKRTEVGEKEKEAVEEAASLIVQQSPEGVLDDFIQEKGVGAFELFECIEKDQQTDLPEPFPDKETQTDEIPVLIPTSLPEEGKKPSPEATVQSLIPLLVASNALFNSDTKDGKVEESSLLEILEARQLLNAGVQGPAFSELAGKYLSEESFGQSEQTPKSTTNDTSFPHNLSQIAPESDLRGNEDFMQISKKRYETVARQLEEKESILRQIKSSIEERRSALTRLDAALEEKQLLLRQLSGELEAAEKECKSLAQQKEVLEKVALRPKAQAILHLAGIEEVPEADDTVSVEFIPEGADMESWKAGYSLGLEKGWSEGIHAGEDLGYERALSEVKGLDESKALEEQNKGLEDSQARSSQPTTPTSRRKSLTYERKRPRRSSNRLKVSPEAEESSGESEASRPGGTIEEASESSESPDTTERRDSSSRGKYWRRPSTIKIKKKNQKAPTKFAEFSFRHTDLGRIWRKRQHPAPRLLAHFLRKSPESLTKSAVMSRKMLLKFCSQVYSSAVQKVREGVDFLLIELAYDEIDKKFVLKKVVEKKLLEVIASALNAVELRRAAMFARLLGVGERAGLPSCSKQSVWMYLTAYEFMLTSKVGIMVGIDETAEVQLFPLSRGIECLKDRLAAFGSLSELSALQMTLERQCKVDYKRVNKSGLVELELVLEVLLQEYDLYQQQVQDNLQFLLEILAYSDNQMTVTATQVALMVRHISPGKLHMVLSEEGGEAFTSAIEAAGSRAEEGENEVFISADRLYELSIEWGLFTNADMEAFFGPAWDSNAQLLSSDDISGFDSLLLSTACSLSSLSKLVVEASEVWTTRLNLFHEGLSDRPAHISQAAYKLQAAELLRLRALLPPKML